jgi:hypothetical protein
MIRFTTELPLDYGEEFEVEGHINKIYRVVVTPDKSILQGRERGEDWYDTDVTLDELYKIRDRIIKSEQEPFWPEDGEDYYYINRKGVISTDIFKGWYIDLLNARIGNCYKTKHISQEQIDMFTTWLKG